MNTLASPLVNNYGTDTIMEAMWILPLSFIQGQEWLIILIAILVLFGGTKIPQLMRGIGKGVGELQEGLKEGKRKFSEELNDTSTEATDSK